MYVDEIRAYTPQNEQEAADQRLILEYIRLFPDNILTRDNEIAHLSSSGFVVNADGTRVLMAHHNIYRVWAWTGGHADGEGDLLSVALREAREETGVEHIRPLSPAIASLDILPVWGHVKRGKWVPSHQHLNVSYLLVADQGRDAGPGRERPLQPVRYGFRAVPGMRTRLHGIQHDQTHRAILHGIAQVRSHGSIGGAPVPEQFAHPVAAVMVAGHGVHRQGKRRELLMQQAVGVRTARLMRNTARLMVSA